jgi:TolB protein
MICPECFHDLPDGSQKCRHCGTVFAEWGDEAPGAPSKRGGGRAAGRGGKAGSADAAPPRRSFRRRLIGLAVLGLVGAVAWLVVEPPLRTVLRPGTVVFVSHRDGNPEVYLMRSSGLEPRRLTRDPAPDYSPSVSRDGRWVAFVSERDGNPNVYVVGTDGNGLRRITALEGPEVGPVWSPGGDRLAFVTGGPGVGDVGIARADGREVVNLTSHPANDYSPAWSPGGTQLAFVSDRDGTPAIYVMYADGRELRRLTQNAGAESSPTWSPDGSRLAFVWIGDVFAIDAGGGGLQRLTDRTRAGGGATGGYEAPSWSPDGRRLVATWTDRAGRRPPELVVVDADGSNLYELGPAEPSSAIWMADSGSVAFVAAPQAGRRWFKARPFSGAKQVCLRRVGGDRRWVRVRDGARALALSALGGPGGVDASLEILTELGGEDPDWTPGGSERLPRFWDGMAWEGA